MKKKIFIYALICTLIGCSSSSSESDYVYTPIKVNGSIANATSGSSGLSTSNLNSDFTNYMIVIQNQVSNRIYISQIDDNGSFNFDENGSDNQYIEYVNDSNGYGSHFMAMLLTKSP